MNRRVRLAMVLLHALGWRGLLRRGRYEFLRRTGLLRSRLPATLDVGNYDPVTWSHHFDLDRLHHRYVALPDFDGLQTTIAANASRVLQGDLTLYGWATKQVGWPPRWHVNPFTGHEYSQVHWTQLSDNDPAAGDIKDVWELSRLPFTTIFARAYVLTGDDRYPEAWWQAIEDWTEHNPPNTGVNWRCGQETSLRAIAICFGLSAFGYHNSTTPYRRDLAHRLLGASAARVEPTLGYALSQRNNHAISELVFLLTVLGPERRLCRLLLEVLDDQFFPDGSYAQQSFTYQRLAVQALQWLLVTRDDLPPGLRARVIDAVARSRDFLVRCSDPVSGWLPNYGANDGALLFDLDGAHYRDFRPFLASLGPTSRPTQSSEAALWLQVDDVTSHRTDADEQASTYLTMRSPRSLLLSRVGTNGHRAGHGDQLAVDFWIDGQNVVTDPGTYRYTAPAPWGNALTGVEVHSTVRATGESVARVGRFLTEPLPDAHIVRRTADASTELVVLERPAGAATLQRILLRLGDRYLVIDRPVGGDADVRWNLTGHVGADVWIAPAGAARTTQPDEEDTASGWTSELYAQREPVPATLLTVPDGHVAVAAFALDGIGWPLHDDLAAALDQAVPDDLARTVLDLLPDPDEPRPASTS